MDLKGITRKTNTNSSIHRRIMGVVVFPDQRLFGSRSMQKVKTLQALRVVSIKAPQYLKK